MEGRHCTAVEEGFLPDSGGAPGPGQHYAAVMMAHCHGNVAALGCGCCRSVGVQAEGHSQEWREELFSGPVGMNGNPVSPSWRELSSDWLQAGRAKK